jgi:ubiquinone biosynthesis protein UbiJ
MEKKFTKRNALTLMLTLSEVKADERLVAYCENELRLLDKKNVSSGEKKLTEKQEQNEKYKADILAFLQEVAPGHKSIAEIWNNVPALADNADMTGQRISALLTQLIKAEKVIRVEEKRKAYFKAA